MYLQSGQSFGRINVKVTLRSREDDGIRCTVIFLNDQNLTSLMYAEQKRLFFDRLFDVREVHVAATLCQSKEDGEPILLIICLLIGHFHAKCQIFVVCISPIQILVFVMCESC